MTARRALVAGVGNIFLGDDGFGSEVARRLAREPLPDGVEVVDYGIRGIHLAYDLLGGYDLLVLVDALAHDAAPGSVRVLEVGVGDLPESPDAAHGIDPMDATDGMSAMDAMDAHAMAPGAVLAGLRSLGSKLPRTYVVGCRPLATEEGIGLSPAVAAAVEDAAATVRMLLEEEFDPRGPAGGRRPTGARAGLARKEG